MKNVRWMTENGVPTPALGTGDARLFLEKGGARSYLNLLLDLLLGLWRSGVADVLKVMALSFGLGWCVPPCAFKTVTIAVSGTAVSVVLRGTEMEEMVHCKTKKKKQHKREILAMAH